jgi:hypothetical protein
MIEELKSTAFDEVFARYNATTADDPAAGTSPGDDFAVAGLDPRKDDADGFVGSIEFPGTGTTLREDVQDAELGMPRDLNGDGPPLDADDHADDYRILPVRIVIRWSGQNGARTFQLVTVLTELGGSVKESLATSELSRMRRGVVAPPPSIAVGIRVVGAPSHVTSCWLSAGGGVLHRP